VLEGDEAVGVAVVEGAEEDGVDDAEQGGVGTEAEGEGEDGEGGEEGRAGEAAGAVAGIAEELFDPGEGAGFAVEFLGLLEAAVFAAGAQAGLFRGEATANEVLFEQGEMGGHFALHLLFPMVVPSEAGESLPEAPHR